MNLSEARRFALELPESTEQPHHDMSSFRVAGKIFVTVPADGIHLHVFADEHEVRAAVADDPIAFEELWWGKKLSGVRVVLDHADPGRVCELIEDAWRRRAPKRVLAAYDGAGAPGS